MELEQIKNYLESTKEPNFRYKQIVKHYYSGRIDSFDAMTDVSKPLRQALQANFDFFSFDHHSISTQDSTKKALLALKDGSRIETVLMKYQDWTTACISCQVGCPLNCSFCATGRMGFKRNLTVSEIIDQILFWNTQILPEYVGRVVFMGMGEPFLNYPVLNQSLEILNSSSGLNLGSRKISVSTAGLTDRILDFGKTWPQINLAISLHSLDPQIRSRLMPVNLQYPLKALLAVCHQYTRLTKRQIFFEYALINGVNDGDSDLKQLVQFLKSNRLFYLNLISLNSTSGSLSPSPQSRIDQFSAGLQQNKVNFSLRRSFGQSINAACGQLAANKC